MIPNMNISRYMIAAVVVWAGLLGAWPNMLAQAQTRAAGPQIPFIGCESDGQVGPLKAPKGKVERLAVPAEIANRVAYYQAENGLGVLAPRGWYCFSIYGSSGSSLYVAPEPIKTLGKGFSGQAIQVSVSFGDTSGRFTVAKTIARVFPDQMEFVHKVISEGIEPASSFPTTPYASDTLQRRGKDIVEFETPANTKGLGSQSLLAISSGPIRGAVILTGPEPNLVQLSMRLSGRYQSLGRTIIQQLETEATKNDGED
jgi:hypothetical protein